MMPRSRCTSAPSRHRLHLLSYRGDVGDGISPNRAGSISLCLNTHLLAHQVSTNHSATSSRPTKRSPCSFRSPEIETILRRPLPQTAYRQQSWWWNTEVWSHQRAWLDAGWKIRTANMQRQIVLFARLPKDDDTADTG